MGLDVGVHVKRKAREFGDEWARQTFGKEWTSAFCLGTIKAAVPNKPYEWHVQYEDEPSTMIQTSRQLTVDRDRERERLARVPVSEGGLGQPDQGGVAQPAVAAAG